MELIKDGSITTPAGFRAGATYCGIKSGGLDLCIVASDTICEAAGVFTTNKVQAAPVHVSRERLRSGRAQAIIVNSGCANACTHEQGLKNAREMADLAARRVGVAPEDVLVASTGVIGVHLPMEKIRAGVEAIVLSRDAGHDAARAIMTTDTRPKTAALRTVIGGYEVRIGGMAKGAGMIHPNMATMLAFITTDAALAPGFASTALREAVDRSFNAISVDGDTSTNDTLLLLANGRAGNPPIAPGGPEARQFQEALTALAIELARMVVRDGEGATKVFEVQVVGALDVADARRAARAVTTSPLVKSAVHGCDPNWGRILCAVGYSGADVDQDRVDLFIGDIQVLQNGAPLPFDRAAASQHLSESDIKIRVDLHLGQGEATAWGCDLSKEYVAINAEYTT